MTKLTSKDYFQIMILIIFATIGKVVPASSIPGSCLRSLAIGVQDRAVTIRMRLKRTVPRARVFITGNVRSLGEWQQPIEMQATEQDSWQVSFSADRAELGLMNTVVFKVTLNTKIKSALYSLTNESQILTKTDDARNGFVASEGDEVELLSIVRHTAATPIAVLSESDETRNAVRKLVEYARRLNTGREGWEKSQQKMAEIRDRWLRKKTLAGLTLLESL
jgi:hypothetical protein